MCILYIINSVCGDINGSPFSCGMWMWMCGMWKNSGVYIRTVTHIHTYAYTCKQTHQTNRHNTLNFPCLQWLLVSIRPLLYLLLQLWYKSMEECTKESNLWKCIIWKVLSKHTCIQKQWLHNQNHGICYKIFNCTNYRKHFIILENWKSQALDYNNRQMTML